MNRKFTAILLALLMLCIPVLVYADDTPFEPMVDITTADNGEMTVVIEDSEIFAANKPWLSLKCGLTEGSVLFNNVNLDPSKYAFADGDVSFEVAAGGTYFVSKEIYNPPADPRVDPDPEPDVTTNEELEPKIETVTNADGSVTTTTTDPDGSNGVVRTDAEGNVTEASATVSNAAIEAASEKDEPVLLHVELPSAESAEEAAELVIDIPDGVETLKVEIPVADVGPTDVVVLVHKDGTEEILPAAALTENGLVIEVEGDVTVKIVDNGKEFTDMPEEEWAQEAIDFVASRELYEGVGDGHGCGKRIYRRS